MDNRFDRMREGLDTAASDRTSRRLTDAATPDTAVSALRTGPEIGADPNALVQDPASLQRLQRSVADSAALRDAPKVRKFVDESEVNAALVSDEVAPLGNFEKLQTWLSSGSKELFGWNRDDRFQGLVGKSVEGASRIAVGTYSTIQGMSASGRAMDAVSALQTMQFIAGGGTPTREQLDAPEFVSNAFTMDNEAGTVVNFLNANEDQRATMMGAVADKIVDADTDVTQAALMVALMVKDNPQGPDVTLGNIPEVIAFYGIQTTALALPAMVVAAAGGRAAGKAAFLGQSYSLGYGQAVQRDILENGPDAFYSQDTHRKGLIVAPLFAATEFLGPVGRVLRRPFAAVPEDLMIRALRARTLPAQVGAVTAAGALEEGVAEMVQEMLVDWGNGELDWTSEGITKYLEAAAVGAIIGGPMTATFETPALVMSARRNSAAQRDGMTNDTLQQIQDQAGTVRLRERSPEKWREFLQSIGTDEGRMYAEADAVQKAVQAGTVDLETLGITQESVDTAIQTGGRVEINQTNWAANYAGTDVGQMVLDNSAVRADGYTPAQLRNFQDLVAETNAENALTTEQNKDIDDRTTALRTERRLAMRAEGMSRTEAAANATLQAAAVRTLAIRTGDASVFDQFQLNVEGTSALGAQKAADVVSRMFDQAPIKVRGSRQSGSGNKHGFMPHLRVKGPRVPAARTASVVLAKTQNQNADRQLAGVSEVQLRHPDPAASPDAWNKMMVDALATDDIPSPPYKFLSDVNGGGAIEMLNRLTEGQIADADQGFENAREFREAYTSGDVTVSDTTKLFLWSFLSRGVSPYTQESMFLDAFADIGQWADAAAAGAFDVDTTRLEFDVGPDVEAWADNLLAFANKAYAGMTAKDKAKRGGPPTREEFDFPKSSSGQPMMTYGEWAATAAPAGSGQSGAGTSHNLNAFGRSFLVKMSQDSGDGRSRIQLIHDMMGDPEATGQQIRREFARLGEGVGIDNKVVSFTLLVAGFDDVMVLDRVQIRNLWNDGRFDGMNLYDGYKVDGKVATGSGLAKLGDGVRGLLVYEALEQGLRERMDAIYTEVGRPDDASVGRYHWETWVAASQQEASHATIDAILRQIKGDATPTAGVTAKEGEYGSYAYGARYGVNADGSSYFLYEVPQLGLYKFDVPSFQRFLTEIKKPKAGVIPKGKFRVTEAGNEPWYFQAGVSLDALNTTAAQFGASVTADDLRQADVADGVDQNVSDGSPADQPSAARTFNQGGLDRGLQEPQSSYSSGGEAGRGLPALEGAPTVRGVSGPDTQLVTVAERYAASAGINLQRQDTFAEVDPERAARIADAYAEMKHDPQDPKVAEAYQNMIEQTLAQYKALVADGYEFYFIDASTAEGKAYASSPFNAILELRNDKRMGVFATDDGFGTGEAFDPTDNPMLAETGFEWTMGPDGAPQTAYANDVFRAVHDAFGHGLEFAGFRARGEENAWQAHVRMFTGSAVAAVTTETRGQNSWLNYGPYGVANQTASVADTVFADQKTGLMPDFTWSEGKAGPHLFTQGTTPQANTVTVAETGEPLRLYRGTTQDFDDIGAGLVLLSTQRGTAAAQAGRDPEAGSNTPRAVEATVAIESPLIIGPVDTDPDTYWVDNTKSLKKQMGGHDGLLIFNDAGEVLAVAKTGKQVTATPRQLDQSEPTQTPAFQEWFGDSKVVNEDGTPMVVYHGTIAAFDTFDASKIGSRDGGFYGEGFYATADMSQADEYAYDDQNDAEGDVLGLYAKIENPFVFNLSEEGYAGTMDATAALLGARPRSEGGMYLTFNLVSGEIRKFTRAAKAAGHDGVVVKRDGEIDEVIVFEPTQFKSEDNVGAFDPTDPNIFNQEGARGRITLPDDVRTGESLIQLFAASDTTTMAHEFSHYLIEVMRSIGSNDGAPQQIVDDLATVHAWMEETTGVAVDGNYTTAQQEAWAEAFENYLMTGAAPSPSLKTVFRKFALWMASVYKSAVGAGTQPSPEIRDVMDRLLATDQEIDAVKLENSDVQLFLEKPPFMSAAEWDTYRKVAERGDAEAHGKLLNRAMETARKKQTKEWKAFYAAALVQATEELSNEREYVLIAALGDKDNNYGRGARLDRDTLIDMFGTAILDDLKALKSQQLIYVKDGADPDQVADMFGFRNGAHMVQTLRTVKPLAEQAAANARAVADAEAPKLTDPEMQEEAEAALKNATRIERVAREAAVIVKEAGGVASSWTVINRAAKARAETLVGAMNVRQAGNYRQFAVAARKAAREAQAQLAKVVRLADGSPTAGGMIAMQKAAEAKRQQLLNDHMYNTARERAKAFDKARKRFAKADTQKSRAKTDPDYMDQADALLQQYDFRQRTEAQVTESTNARKSLAEFILLQQEAGVDGELAIPPQVLLRGNVPQNYTELTVDQLENVVDAIDNLLHAGKAVQKSYLENETLLYGDMVAEITTTMSQKMKAAKRPDRESGQRSGIPKFLGALNQNIETALTTIRRMDGWEDNGPAMRFIFRPLQRAAAAVEERREQETMALKGVYDKHYSKKEIRALNDKRKHGIYVPELGDTFSKAGLLSIALNTGNEGNFQRLTDVEGVDGNGAYDGGRVDAALTKHLTENDWRFVQDMWDHINSFWPEISALERDVSGVVPKQVDSVLQVSAPDFVTGGYYPIEYDADLNIASFLSGADDAYKDATGGRSGKAQTRHGHTEARLRSTGMALNLNLGVAENHIMKVVHDLAMRKPINHAVKMLNNPAIGRALNTFGRTSDLQALRSWLVDSAAGDGIAASGMAAVMRYARKALTVKYIGYNIGTLVLQPFGAIQAGVIVGNKELASGYIKYMGRAKYWNDFIQTNSAHMRLRVRSVNREMNEFAREARTAETAAAGALTRWNNTVASAVLAPIGHIQYWTVDIPVFIAAFEKARGAGIAEADAISLAENAVDRAGGSGSFLNRASFERGSSVDGSARRTEYIKTFTMLSAYVHSKYNGYLEVKGRTDFNSPLDSIKFTASMVQLFALEAALVSLYRSIGEDPDDDEGTGKWLASIVASEGLGLHPATRPFSSYVSGYGTGTVPLGDFAELLAKGGSSAFDIAASEGDLNDWLNAFDAGATWFMMPTGQMKKIIRAITADDPAAQLGRVALGLSPLRE